MKDRNDELIQIARDGNRYTNDYSESTERTLRQLHNNRIRDNLYHEGYALGRCGGNIEEITEMIELDGKMVEKRTNGSFKGGYKLGLEDYKQSIKDEETRKAR